MFCSVSDTCLLLFVKNAFVPVVYHKLLRGNVVIEHLSGVFVHGCTRHLYELLIHSVCTLNGIFLKNADRVSSELFSISSPIRDLVLYLLNAKEGVMKK